jgi:UDP-N-acetylmuramoyl-tripeptide--D-alanyl-D-alanine ligase
VLGDMLELGASSEAAHHEAGRGVAEAGLQGLWAVGRWADVMVQGAKSGGMSGAVALPDAGAAAAALEEALRPGDIVLLKGSRGSRLERIEELWAERRKEAEVATP